MTTFALYRNTTVQLLGIEEGEALISYDCGKEEYVSFADLEILP